jgi:hypothetical protein
MDAGEAKDLIGDTEPMVVADDGVGKAASDIAGLSESPKLLDDVPDNADQIQP